MCAMRGINPRRVWSGRGYCRRSGCASVHRTTIDPIAITGTATYGWNRRPTICNRVALFVGHQPKPNRCGGWAARLLPNQ
jgi:hypothetical protein